MSNMASLQDGDIMSEFTCCRQEMEMVDDDGGTSEERIMKKLLVLEKYFSRSLMCLAKKTKELGQSHVENKRLSDQLASHVTERNELMKELEREKEHGRELDMLNIRLERQIAEQTDRVVDLEGDVDMLGHVTCGLRQRLALANNEVVGKGKRIYVLENQLKYVQQVSIKS